jgi:hypothetical protein
MGLIRDRVSPRVQIAKWGEMLIGMGVEPLLEKEKEDQDEGRWAVETSN